MIGETFDVMLGALRPVLAIGGVTYRMVSIDMEQSWCSRLAGHQRDQPMQAAGSGELVLTRTTRPTVPQPWARAVQTPAGADGTGPGARRAQPGVSSRITWRMRRQLRGTTWPPRCQLGRA